MKKRRRAWVSMLLTWGLILVIVGILWVFSFPWRGLFTVIQKDTNTLTIASNLASLALVIIELCVIGIAIYGLHHYFRYYRPSVFIFKGFSNSSKLTEIDHVPVDFDNLAREELAYQFCLIYQKLGGAEKKRQPTGENDPDHSQQSSANQTKQLYLNSRTKVVSHPAQKALLKNLYIEEMRSQDEDELLLPSLQVEQGILGTEKAKWLRHSLKEAMENSKTVDLSDLVNAIERTAPKGMAWIMNFMDIIFPARAITVTCHLQWRRDGSDGIGITFEVTDSKKKGGVSFTQTIWSDSTNSADAQKKLTERYIELLKPAMRWLGLLFWEQETRLDIPNNDEKGLLRALFYLLGVLSFDCADSFPLCSDFFDQQARRRLSRVREDRYPKFSLPYFIQAEREMCKATSPKVRDEDARQLFQRAIRYYDQALDDSQWENALQVSKNFIAIRRALAQIHLKDEYPIEEACEPVEETQVEEMIKRGDPISSEDELEECSLCFYNLAHWHANRALEYQKKKVSKKEEVEKGKARRYLIYSFVRHPDQWYNDEQTERRRKAFQRFFDTQYLFRGDDEGLWGFLEKKENRQAVFALAKSPGKEFYWGVNSLFSSWWKPSTSASAENPLPMMQTVRT